MMYMINVILSMLGYFLCLSVFAAILLANASIANQSKQIRDRMQIMLLDF